MRIAILFRGAISKIEGKLKQSGDTNRLDAYVNFACVKNSIQKHIINCNPECQFDIFIHNWNEDIKDELIKLYSPKQYLFENNEIYKQLIIDKLQYCNTNNQGYPQVSQALSLSKVCSILNDTPNHYDKIIIYRPDLFLWKDMKMEDYDVSSKIFVNNYDNGRGDFHFVMNQVNAINFGKMINHISSDLRPLQHEHIHRYIQTVLHINLVMDNIIAGRDQEIVRKLNHIVEAGIISEKQLNEYGITIQEIQTYNAD